MSLADKLEKYFLELPKREREKKMNEREESAEWNRLSLAVATEENDDTLYTINDLKEVWK
jgi:hypothetical protein